MINCPQRNKEVMGCRKQFDITLALMEGCLEVWKNYPGVQRGDQNDLSLPDTYTSLTISQATAEPF